MGGNCLREHRESRRSPSSSRFPAARHHPVEVDLRASAVFSSSECLFSGGDDALATLFLALTHHAWPYLYSGATTKSSTTKSSTTAQPQHLRRGPKSAAARTQRTPELQQ